MLPLYSHHCCIPSINFSVEYYHGNSDLPVYGHPKHGCKCDEIVHILLNPIFKEELLSKTHPVSVEHNVSFVVDLTSLSDPNDVRADDLGSWTCTGSRRLSFMVKFGNAACHIVSGISGSGANLVQIRRQYHVHGTDSDLHRMIAFVENFEGRRKCDEYWSIYEIAAQCVRQRSVVLPYKA